MRVWVLGLVVALGACGRAPVPAHPALWEVTGPGGQRGWLFGTIHALPRPVDWRTPAVRGALAQADEVAVEIADLNDGAAVRAAFLQAAGAAHGALPPLAERVVAGDRGKLAALEAEAGADTRSLDAGPTWAAALALGAGDGGDAANGVDRALLADHGGVPVVELEGARAQFAAFAGLSETSQQALLAAVVRGYPDAAAERDALAAAWARGDMGAIARVAEAELGGDAGLREGLSAGRNRRWAARVVAEMARGRRPFVAVGAAHMAGDQGLPALLARAGFGVKRVE